MHVRLLAAVTVAIATTALTEPLDLLTAYRQSAQASPLVAQSVARLHAQQYGKNIARSALAPRLLAEGSASVNDLDLEGFGPQPIDESYSPYSYRFALEQPLINAAAWSTLKSSRSTVEASEAELQAVQQDLMLQVSEAYFGVLRARALERVAQSEQTLLQEIQDRAKGEHRAGTGDIIAVEEAQARLDGAQARLLAARNQVQIARRALERLTHESVGDMVDLGPLEPNAPAADKITEWEETALSNQPRLQKARLEVEANHLLAKSADRRRWPVISLNAQYDHADSTFAPDINRRESSIGIRAVWTLFQGGEINATHAKAEALAQASLYGMENIEDRVRLETQRAFLELENSVAQLEAAMRALNSSTTALRATQKGHEVGSRTVADVLDSIQRHTQMESEYFLALYNHVLNRLRLKAVAGVLSEKDVEEVNALLSTHPQPRDLSIGVE